MVFKKGAKLKKVEKWHYRKQKVEGVNSYTRNWIQVHL